MNNRGFPRPGATTDCLWHDKPDQDAAELFSDDSVGRKLLANCGADDGARNPLRMRRRIDSNIMCYCNADSGFNKIIEPTVNDHDCVRVV